MTSEDLKLELSKISTQQAQWHDDFLLKQKEFDQRESHWLWQKGIWIFMSGVGLTTLVLRFI